MWFYNSRREASESETKQEPMHQSIHSGRSHEKAVDRAREFLGDERDRGREFVREETKHAREFVHEELGRGADFARDEVRHGVNSAYDGMKNSPIWNRGNRHFDAPRPKFPEPYRREVDPRPRAIEVQAPVVEMPRRSAEEIAGTELMNGKGWWKDGFDFDEEPSKSNNSNNDRRMSNDMKNDMKNNMRNDTRYGTKHDMRNDSGRRGGFRTPNSVG